MARNVHRSGALGLLLEQGHIKSINDIEPRETSQVIENNYHSAEPLYRTDTGIIFKENELIFIEPSECEPWVFANRLDDDMGDIDELISSIKANSQLQPALVRQHPHPHGKIKYEIIFGRRRHVACQTLGIKFLVIKKEIVNNQEAFLAQNDENKHRTNVSNYSNALHFKKLLDGRIFRSSKELAEKLNISSTSLSELMSYTKIPSELVKRIPNVHTLSTNMALKINALLTESEDNLKFLFQIADKIGTSITSAKKLENALAKLKQPTESDNQLTEARVFKSETGEKLFTFKVNGNGSSSIVLNKNLKPNLNFDELLNRINAYLIEAQLANEITE